MKCAKSIFVRVLDNMAGDDITEEDVQKVVETIELCQADIKTTPIRRPRRPQDKAAG